MSVNTHGSWVVKDPRMCVLFPFWREILARPFCVLLYRAPLPVARSLAARDGFPLSFGIALWERYTLSSLAATRGLPRILLSHRELMADPAAVARRLHRWLTELDAPRRESLRLLEPEAAGAVLDPALLHHHPRDPETERIYLTPPQLALLEALDDGSALAFDPVPPLSPGARELLLDYERLSALPQRLTAQAHVQAADLHRTGTWIDELDALLSAVLESRSWRIGRAVTSLWRRFGGRPALSVGERRDRLMTEVRRWREPRR